MSRQTTLLFALGLPLVACATTDTSETTASTPQALITNVIATPDVCNQGVGKANCLQTPPSTFDGDPLRWKVDGKFSPGEYSGATEMPYVLKTQTLGGHGTVYVNRVTDKKAAAPARDVLFIYLQDLSVPVNQHGVPQAKIDVFFDYARFEGPDAFISSEDRRLLLDLDADKLIAEFKGLGSGVSASWTSLPGPEAGLEFRSGGCKLAATGTSATCSGELQIPLPASVLSKPAGANFDDPGIGFRVAHAEVNAGMPELVDASLFNPARTNRTLWETLVFGRPRGFPLKIMSWNVHHGSGDDFERVTNDDLAQFLALNDIVALQEVWRVKDAHEIADAANKIRVANNLLPFHVYGPVDFQPGWTKVLLEAFDTFEETQSGMFVLTPLLQADGGNLVFDQADACRGDDCFRARGVQWLRLSVDKPDSMAADCRDGSTQNCPKTPSGDDYVDFFNVTLQSEDPPTCDDLDTWHALEPALKMAIEQIPLVGEIIKALITAADALIEDDLHCTSLTSAGVRDTQLGRANTFIAAATRPAPKADPDRPSIIAGDFNVDGIDLGGAAYQAMLVKLGVFDPGTSSDSIDEVNPSEWDWDIDHGDLANEREPKTRCLGTVIGTNGGTADLTCPDDGNFNGSARTSYILVRPRVLPSKAKDLAPERWIASKGADKALAWSAPFPSNNGSTGGPPDRLSDKKPVVANVTLVPWVTPAKYHPTWAHDAILRVNSVDGTGITDCPTCGNIDPYAKLSKKTTPTNHSGSKQTSECTGEQTPSLLVNNCMGDWFFKETQAPGTIDSFAMRADVWEADDTSGDDELNISTTSSFTFNTGPNQATFGFSVDHGSSSSQFARDVFDTEPSRMCSSVIVENPDPDDVEFATVCHQVEIIETPPAGP